MKIFVEEFLSLESVSVADATETYAIIDSQREYLKKWLPWVDYNTNVDDSATNIKSCMQKNDAGTSLNLSIKYKGKVIGRIGLHYIDKSNNITSIGYWLSKKEVGKGIMTKAVNVLCKHCFEELKMNRIEIACATDNHKSKAIPERLGFKLEGVMREIELMNGEYLDHRIYSKLAQQSNSMKS